MRARIMIIGLGTLLGASGCTSLGSAGDGVAVYRKSLDTEVIAYVESNAARAGTRVFWVNPPRKKADEEGSR